ncbi:hypothetical protein LBMAG49_23890 [Planctomycetota bacterium]|nr:hypothetical protein LBMAG49_23890 [Planctomycetota bacterium]
MRSAQKAAHAGADDREQHGFVQVLCSKCGCCIKQTPLAALCRALGCGFCYYVCSRGDHLATVGFGGEHERA